MTSYTLGSVTVSSSHASFPARYGTDVGRVCEGPALTLAGLFDKLRQESGVLTMVADVSDLHNLAHDDIGGQCS